MSVAGPMDEEIAAVAATTDYISKDRAKGKSRRGRTVSSLSHSFSFSVSLSPLLSLPSYPLRSLFSFLSLSFSPPLCTCMLAEPSVLYKLVYIVS